MGRSSTIQSRNENGMSKYKAGPGTFIWSNMVGDPEISPKSGLTLGTTRYSILKKALAVTSKIRLG